MMTQPHNSNALLMKAAWLAEQADKAGGVSTELHHKPGGQIVVGCHVEGESSRYFEITVETDGSLSLLWTRGAQIIRVTGLAAPSSEAG